MILFSNQRLRHCCGYTGWMPFARYSYFAELRRQSLANTAAYNEMINMCQLSAEIKDLLSQMEADEIEADLHTYVALHQAWWVCLWFIICLSSVHLVCQKQHPCCTALIEGLFRLCIY